MLSDFGFLTLSAAGFGGFEGTGDFEIEAGCAADEAEEDDDEPPSLLPPSPARPAAAEEDEEPKVELKRGVVGRRNGPKPGDLGGGGCEGPDG